ncbi:threonine/serine exporter family protein, partial [Xanthomonas citri pv. citri]|nr:threonine/serine exporter family protein [Xanthomonas citri pv. citri]
VYMAASNHPLPLSPSLIVAAGIVSLLAGGSFVAASQDALDGYVVTSSGRFLEGFVQTGGVILGVITAMWIGLRLGVPGYISPA